MSDRRDPQREWSTEDDRVLAELLREAGRRSPLPEDFDQVRAEVAAAWCGRERRPRWRRRAAWLAAAALAALAAGLTLWWAPRAIGPPAATMALETTWGEVTVGPRALVTEAGRAAFTLPSGHLLQVDRFSRLELVTAERVRLTAGAIYVDSGLERGSAASLTVETALGAVRELGTQYQVRVGESELSVRVREGRVSLEHEDRSTTVADGEELTATAAGAVSRRSAPRTGPEWEWVLESTPPMVIEGESLLACLEWAARAGGWRLDFAAGAESASAGIVLHGSIDGLTPHQALEVVLAGTGLRHRVEGDRLRIEPQSAP